MIGHLQDFAWLATLVTGLALSLAWRTRLGRRAAPAIAGFALLLATTAIGLLWEPDPGTPASSDVADLLAAVAPVDLAILATTYLAHPAGLALLLLAVLRSRAIDSAATPVATENG